MKKFNMLKTGAAPIALSAALLAMPAFAQDALPQDADAADEQPVIIVTGTRIQSPNLTAAAPVTAITAADIKLSGTGKTEDILNSLPQVFAAQSSTLSNGATGTATVDLRGLGASRTLVLINGRRLMPGDPNDSTSGSAADLNFIPASMIKRIDVLTGGASATYGADAVAGVVNFVMDTDFQGFRIDANYSFYQHNNRNKITPPLLEARAAAGIPGFSYPKGSVADGGNFDATVSFGSSFDDGNGHFMAYAGYRKVKPVLQARRDYSACTLQTTNATLGDDTPGNPVRFDPAAPYRCGGSGTSNNALIFATFSSTSTTSEGGTNTNFGTTSTLAGLGDGTIAPFAANRYNFAPLNYFQRPDERYTAGVFADYEISEAIHPYMEFMFMDDRTLAQIAPSGDFGNTLTINCDNPLMSAQQLSVICASQNLINGFVGTFPLAVAAGYNPNPGNAPIDFIDSATGATYNRAFFQLLRRNVEGGPRISDLQHTAFRTVIGTRGDLGKAWSYDAYYQYGRTNYSQVYSNEFSVARITKALDAVTGPGGEVVCRSFLDGTDPACRPYNTFSGSPSAAALAYVTSTGFIKGQTSQQVLSLNFTGRLGEYGIKMPWAEDGVSVALGAEYRKDSLELDADDAFNAGDLTGQGAPTLDVKGNYEVKELLGEINIPIVQDSFIHSLSFNGAYRYSDYSLSNGRSITTDTYKLEAEFSPIRDIKLRATYNRAVRVPNIQELFAPQYVGLDGVTDPCAAIPVVTATDYGCLAQGLVVGQSVTANPAGQYNGLLGGTDTLLPEKATTKTIGVLIQPSMVPGLSLSVDWFDIEITNAVQRYGADAILNACNRSTATTVDPACALVNRDPAGSLWLTSGGFVEDLQTNVGSVSTRGVEVNAAYSRQIGNLGTLGFSLVGTYLDEYATDNGLTEAYDCAGYYGPTCATVAPEWRHRARMTLNMKNGLGVSLAWRYFGPVDIEYNNPSTTLGQPHYTIDEKIGAQSYFDLGLTAKVGRHFSWQLGVNNILDKQPPLIHSGSSGFGVGNCATTICNGNTNPGTYDALGRYIYTGVTLDF